MRFKAVALLVVVLALTACAAPDSPERARAAAIASRYGLTLGKSVKSYETTLPTHLDPAGVGGFEAEYVYASVQEAAARDGFDLRPYLGMRVTERQFLVSPPFAATDTWLNVIEHDSEVIAAYITVEDLTPGIRSLSSSPGP